MSTDVRKNVFSVLMTSEVSHMVLVTDHMPLCRIM